MFPPQDKKMNWTNQMAKKKKDRKVATLSCLNCIKSTYLKKEKTHKIAEKMIGKLQIFHDSIALNLRI